MRGKQRRLTTIAVAMSWIHISFFFELCVLTGRLPLEEEQQIVEQTHQWLEKRADQSAAYKTYLAEWGNWQNPWTE